VDAGDLAKAARSRSKWGGAIGFKKGFRSPTATRRDAATASLFKALEVFERNRLVKALKYV